MIKSIRNWLREFVKNFKESYRVSSQGYSEDFFVLKTNSYIPTSAAQYFIHQVTDDVWAAELKLTFDIPEKIERTIRVPLEIAHKSPLIVAYALQLMGPVFMNINMYVPIMDREGKILKILDLRETIFLESKPKAPVKVTPTNEGPIILQ